MRDEQIDRVAALLRKAVDSGEVSAAYAFWGGSDRAFRGMGAGVAAEGRVPDADSLFDLASLTKPVVATLALRLDRSGALPLESRLGQLGLGVRSELAGHTLEDLLRHRAHLAPWYPLYSLGGTRKQALAWLWGRAPLGARLGTYSDLGFILYARAAERVLGAPLSALLESELGGFIEPSSWNSGFTRRGVPCQLSNQREVRLAAGLGVTVAEVEEPPKGWAQDGNARFLGGCAGHAGLFMSAAALAALAQLWLEPEAELGGGRVRAALGGARHFPLGWRRRTVSGSAGPALSPSAFGHIGFTGGSLWVDPQSCGIHILLTHRTRVDVDLSPMRRRFHRLSLGLG